MYQSKGYLCSAVLLAALGLFGWYVVSRCVLPPDGLAAVFSIVMAIAVVAIVWSGRRQQGAKDLTQSVSLLRATLESTADGILVVDLQGRIVEFNQRFAQIWQVPPDLLVAGRDHDLPTSSRDEQMMRSVLGQLTDPAGFLAKVTELYTQPEASSFDVLEFKDGRTLERYSLPQRIAGQAVGRVWSFRDVSDRKRAEAALRASELQQAHEIHKQAHDEQLQRHRAELAHAARLGMIGEMAAGLAHELNHRYRP